MHKQKTKKSLIATLVGVWLVSIFGLAFLAISTSGIETIETASTETGAPESDDELQFDPPSLDDLDPDDPMTVFDSLNSSFPYSIYSVIGSSGSKSSKDGGSNCSSSSESGTSVSVVPVSFVSVPFVEMARKASPNMETNQTPTRIAMKDLPVF